MKWGEIGASERLQQQQQQQNLYLDTMG